MKVDKKGIQFFKEEEGVLNYVYKDSKGLDTFGIGHLLVAGDDYLRKYTKKNPSSDELVEEIFKKDLKRFEDRVNLELNKRGIKVSQGQFNALVSLAFNIGEGGFAKSHLLRDLKEILRTNDVKKLTERFEAWRSGGILLKRRQREAKLFIDSWIDSLKKESDKSSGTGFILSAIILLSLYFILK